MTDSIPVDFPCAPRVTHGCNALAAIIIAMGGRHIDDASHVSDFTVPKTIGLGGWRGG
jgi:hypothetical protein